MFVCGPKFVSWIHNRNFDSSLFSLFLGVPPNTISILIINTINGGGYWRSGNIIYSSRVRAEKTDIAVMDTHTYIINTRYFFPLLLLFEHIQPWILDRYMYIYKYFFFFGRVHGRLWESVLNTKSFPLSPRIRIDGNGELRPDIEWDFSVLFISRRYYVIQYIHTHIHTFYMYIHIQDDQ